MKQKDKLGNIIDKEVKFYIWYRTGEDDLLNKHADLIGKDNRGYRIYAVIDMEVVKYLLNSFDIFPDTTTKRIGGWDYFNNVLWDDDCWKKVWETHGPFMTASWAD